MNVIFFIWFNLFAFDLAILFYFIHIIVDIGYILLVVVVYF